MTADRKSLNMVRTGGVSRTPVHGRRKLRFGRGNCTLRVLLMARVMTLFARVTVAAADAHADMFAR